MKNLIRQLNNIKSGYGWKVRRDRFEVFLSALIIAALILIVMSIPKLVIFFVWTIYKLFFYEFASRLLKSKNLKNMLPKRGYRTLLKVSEDSAEKLKS